MIDLVNVQTNTTNWAQWYARVVGVVLVLLGIWGFAVANPLGINFQLTMVHNWVHLLTGAVALYFGFAPNLDTRTIGTFAVAFGAVYLLVSIIGLVTSNFIGMILTGSGNVLHFALALTGLAAGSATLAAVGQPVMRRRPSV